MNKLLLTLIVCLTITSIFAQTQEPKQKSDSEIVDDFLKKDSIGFFSQDPLLDSTSLAERNKSMREYYLYKNFGYEHRAKVFKWQLLSTKIIFVVVLFLVLCGVFFSGLQFYYAVKKGNTSDDLSKSLATDITASATEIKVSSPVLGVIILTLSFLFFYMYLIYVYPIKDVF